ncbi:MAG: HDOD domain-containing protein [Gammaproteobacteria bacterium]|nr:HDOD domain-containing protein [Gammaproteobacteria bacterium]
MALSAEYIVRNTLQVASLPTIYSKIDEALNSANCSNQYLVDILSEDTALSARLLRLANSAMFNFPSKIDSVSNAITIIGTQQLRALVLASSVMKLFKDIPKELIDMEMFWRHSIACAVSARIIASLRRAANVEYFFLAGLLHDIGRLIMFKEVPAEISQAMQQAKQSQVLLYKVEKEILGFDHAKLGSMLLKEWKLPIQLIDSTAFHHNPKRSADFKDEVAVIHVSDIIANSLQLGSSGEHLVPKLDEQAWDCLGLPDAIINTIINELHKQYTIAVDFVLGEGGTDEG